MPDYLVSSLTSFQKSAVTVPAEFTADREKSASGRLADGSFSCNGLLDNHRSRFKNAFERTKKV